MNYYESCLGRYFSQLTQQKLFTKVRFSEIILKYLQTLKFR